MPVQIPEVKRFNPQETQSVGRVQAEVPNVAAAVAPQTKAALGLADKVGDYFQKEEDFAIDTLGKEMAYKYHGTLEANLDEAQRQGGDPTEVYAKLDEQNRIAREELLASKADLPDRYKEAVGSKLKDVDDKYFAKRTTAQGQQAYTYETKLTTARSKQIQAELVDATSRLDPKNPDTLIPIQSSLDGLDDNEYKSGEKWGLATRDPVTGWKVNPSVDNKTRELKSEALSQSILNLNAAGETEKAQMLVDRFGHLINAKANTRISLSSKRAMEDNTVYGLAQEARIKGAADPLAYIDGREDLSPKVKERAKGVVDAEDSRRKRMIERKSSTNANEILKLIELRDQGPTPFANEEDLRADTKVKQLLENVTDAKDRDAIFKKVNVPASSDIKSKAKMNELVISGDLEGMDALSFEKVTSRLNKSDRNYYRNIYINANKQDKAKETADIRFITQHMKDSLLANGYVDRNQYLKYDDEALSKVIKATDEFEQISRTFPSNMSRLDLKKEITAFAISKQKKETYTYAGKPRFVGTGVKPSAVPTSTPKPKSAEELSPEDRKALMRKFNNERQRFPNKQELNEYFLKQGN